MLHADKVSVGKSRNTSLNNLRMLDENGILDYALVVAGKRNVIIVH
jgi:hypothetical protein